LEKHGSITVERRAMSKGSAIEWTDSTWNPVTGCTKVSPGCDHCYAETFAERFRGVAEHPFENGFDLTLRYDRLTKPLDWTKPQRVFVNSMSDLFHRDVPDEYIVAVFNVMSYASKHQFQVLTKRAERLARLSPKLKLGPNVWIGVSVESANFYWRIDHLRMVPAAVRFLSCEPLLAPLDSIPLAGIDWVIVGGESGHGARPMAESWVRDIRNQCDSINIPFFFKQWGGRQKKKAGRLLDGRTHDEMPRAGAPIGTSRRTSSLGTVCR
jgi:protein gp37